MLFCVSELLQFMYQLLKKKSIIFGLFGFFVLALVAGGSNSKYSVDYATYFMVYNNNELRQNYFEKGFNWLQEIFYDSNFSYESFRLVVVLIAMIFLFFGVLRFTRNVSHFVAVYGSLFFLNDANQLRNFLMLSVAIFGISFLVVPSAKNFIISTVIVLMAAQLQSLGYIFLLIILLRCFSKKMIKKSWQIMAIVTGIILVLSSSGTLKLIMNTVLNTFQVFMTRGNLAEKINGQYTYGSSKVGFLIVVIEVFLSFLCEIKLLNIDQRDIKKGEFLDYENKTVILYLSNVVSLLTLPLMSLAFDYARIQHNMGVLLLINMSLYFEKKQNNNEEKIILALYVVTLLIFSVNNYLLWGPYFIQSISKMIGI